MVDTLETAVYVFLWDDELVLDWELGRSLRAEIRTGYHPEDFLVYKKMAPGGDTQSGTGHQIRRT